MISLAVSFGGLAGGQLAVVALGAHTFAASNVPTESSFSLGFWSCALLALTGLALALLIRRPAATSVQALPAVTGDG
jgi:hypothetical protein